RMFQSPVAPPSGVPGMPPVGAGRQTTETDRPSHPSAEPGEFTRMFHSPMPDAPVQGDWPPAAAKPQEPGEFTRMFQAPSAARPEAGPTPPKGGEFTEFFKASPGGMPMGPQFPSASQFPQAPAAPAPAPSRQEVGDYTRMFGPGARPGPPPAVPGAPPAAPAPAPPAAYGPGGGATQAFRAP